MRKVEALSLSEVDNIISIRGQYPDDMGFFSIRGNNARKLRARWLEKYWDFRSLHDSAKVGGLISYLSSIGADSSSIVNCARGALIGLMLGDALGMSLKFSRRDQKYVSDLIPGGPFDLPKGYWTDGSSMAFCMAYSLVKCKGFNPKHVMDCFSYWYRFGAYSSTELCFDVGNSIRMAIEKYLQTGEPFSGSFDPLSAGNGSLMRLVPIAIFYSDDSSRQFICRREFKVDASSDRSGRCLSLFLSFIVWRVERRIQGTNSRRAIFSASGILGGTSVGCFGC